MRRIFIIAFVFLAINVIKAQDNVGIGTTTPKAKALLDLTATNKGFLVPRVTTAQRIAIAPVVADYHGLLVYDLTMNSFFYWNGNAWVEITDLDDTNELDSLVYNPNNNNLSLVNAGGTTTINLSGLIDDNDSDSTNEVQLLSIVKDTIFLSLGNMIVLPNDSVIDDDSDPTNEIQTLMKNAAGDSLFISSGNGIAFPVDNDTSALNEIQLLSINSSLDSLFVSGGNGVALPPDNDTSATNEIQFISINGTLDSITLSNGNTIALPLDNDTSAANEIQFISINATLDSITISNGNTIALPLDNDTSASNEIQMLFYNAAQDTIFLSNGNGIPVVASSTSDNQILFYNAARDSLFIQDGNGVPIIYDNDTSPVNEIQALFYNIAQDSLFISGANGVPIVNEFQDLYYNAAGDSLLITNGVGVPVLIDNDTSPVNEIQSLFYNVAQDSLFISGSNGVPVIGQPQDLYYNVAQDSLFITSGNGIPVTGSYQDLYYNAARDSLFITFGNGIPVVVDNDTSPVNEIQTLSLNPTMDSISISGGNTIALPPDDDWTVNGTLMYNNNTGNVGIGTTTPSAKLHVVGNNGFLAVGTFGGGGIPINGAGARLMWYSAKASLRAGGVTATQWDAASVGNFSAAMGFNTIAQGAYSFAMGNASSATAQYSATFGETNNATGTHSFAQGRVSTASGDFASAFGETVTASGDHSFAFGELTTASGANAVAGCFNSTASGDESIALGLSAMATNQSSVAIGQGATSSGFQSIAIGNATNASATAAVALGFNCTANGNHSVVIGKDASSNTFQGCFVFGDAAVGAPVNATGNNRFIARASGGYYLYSNVNFLSGVQLPTNANAWAMVSDERKKENFKTTDGEYVLSAISGMRLGSWNYIGQDPGLYRHYGPVAQEFHKAFGHDGIGYTGNDTLIGSGEFMGINMIAIKALEQRTSDLRQELELKNEEIRLLKNMLNTVIQKVEALEVKSSLEVIKTESTLK